MYVISRFLRLFFSLLHKIPFSDHIVYFFQFIQLPYHSFLFALQLPIHLPQILQLSSKGLLFLFDVLQCLSMRGVGVGDVLFVESVCDDSNRQKFLLEVFLSDRAELSAVQLLSQRREVPVQFFKKRTLPFPRIARLPHAAHLLFHLPNHRYFSRQSLLAILSGSHLDHPVGLFDDTPEGFLEKCCHLCDHSGCQLFCGQLLSCGSELCHFQRYLLSHDLEVRLWGLPLYQFSNFYQLYAVLAQLLKQFCLHLKRRYR